MKKIIWIGIVLIVSFWSVRAFFTQSFIPTHDGEYHIIRFWQFDKNIHEGILVPVWGSDLNHGFGVPIFSFFYPFPNYVGEFFHIVGFSFIDSLKLTLGISMIFSSLFFYLWLRCFFKPFASCLGSIAYVLAPYHLVVVSIRGSVGESWALVMFPLSLFLITTLNQSAKRKFYVEGILSFSLALLVLSHNVMGIIFFVLCFLYAQSLLYLQKTRNSKQIFISFILSMLLSSFFFVPILLERNFVTGLDIVNYKDHFLSFFQLIIPSWGSGFSVPGISDQLSFQIGIPHLVALIVAICIGIKKRNKLVLVFIVVFLLSAFFMLEQSRSIWKLFSFLRFIQFPWRLLSVSLVISSFLFAYVVESKPKIGIVLVLLCFLFYAQYTNTVRFVKREDDYLLKDPNWAYGTSTVGSSFNTKWFSLPKQIQDDEFVSIDGNAKISDVKRTVTKSMAQISTDKEVEVKVKRAYYPGWNVYIDTKKISYTSNNHGIIQFTVPKGRHSIMVSFETTLTRLVMLWISTVTFAGILFYNLLSLYENRTKHKTA